jgi:hypothetical protein
MIFSRDFTPDLTILGLKSGEDYTEAYLKREYRKMSLRWHPDKNPNNEEAATEMFKRISTAYTSLKEEMENPSARHVLRCPKCGGDHDLFQCPDLFDMGAGPARSESPPTPSTDDEEFDWDRTPPRQPPRASPRCDYCGKVGHVQKDCHRWKRSQMECSYCHKKGHTYDQCRHRMRNLNTCGNCRTAGRPCNHRPENCHHTFPCDTCGKTGHSTANCRYKGVPKCEHCGDFGHRIERCFKLHPEMIPTCGLCGEKGHFRHRCVRAFR